MVVVVCRVCVCVCVCVCVRGGGGGGLDFWGKKYQYYIMDHEKQDFLISIPLSDQYLWLTSG